MNIRDIKIDTQTDCVICMRSECKSLKEWGCAMKRKYSVFHMNVGSCSDRYCGAYGRPFGLGELLDRIQQIDLISGVDLVATPELMAAAGSLGSEIASRNLQVVSVAADIFTQEKWGRGSFSSPDPRVRKDAVAHAMEVMDLTESLGADLLTIWPGQDGYDYLFQVDYLKARQWFTECIAELCDYKPDMTIGLEYKQKEPRTHSLVNTVGTTLLMCQATGRTNCGAVLDFGHALLGYENPAESLALISQYGNGVAHVHINDNYRLWDDDMIVGTVRIHEFLEFFYWLRKTDYSGWITIDQFPYREDGKKAVEESALWLDYMESLLDEADMEEIEVVLRKNDGAASSNLMRRLLSGSF